MFKKIPYGVKVRVRGCDITGYHAELCIRFCRAFSFMNMWTPIVKYVDGKEVTTYSTLAEAQLVALDEYDEWIRYYSKKERLEKERKAVARRTVWSKP